MTQAFMMYLPSSKYAFELIKKMSLHLPPPKILSTHTDEAYFAAGILLCSHGFNFQFQEWLQQCK